MLKKLGIIIVFVSFALLFATGVYHLFIAIYNDPDLPMMIKIAVSGLIVGFIVLLIALIKERVEDLKNEKFDRS